MDTTGTQMLFLSLSLGLVAACTLYGLIQIAGAINRLADASFHATHVNTINQARHHQRANPSEGRPPDAEPVWEPVAMSPYDDTPF